MTNFLQNIAGMSAMTDQVIATDFLISAKSGVIFSALAVTEVATLELKEALREQLRDALDTHEQITNYMISKGFYHPHDLKEQLQVDMKVTEIALNLPD